MWQTHRPNISQMNARKISSVFRDGTHAIKPYLATSSKLSPKEQFKELQPKITIFLFSKNQLFFFSHLMLKYSAETSHIFQLKQSKAWCSNIHNPSHPKQNVQPALQLNPNCWVLVIPGEELMHLGKNLVHFVQCKARMSEGMDSPGTEQLLSHSIVALIAATSEPAPEKRNQIQFCSDTHLCNTC